MTNRTPRSSKSLFGLRAPVAAEQAASRRAVGASKVVAEGVPSSSGPHLTDGPRIVGMLHIGGASRGGLPTAHSWCSCGRDLKAFGHRQIERLAADHVQHRSQCPLLTERKEAT
ncbi:hypothetical protein [Streptomyces sp. NPDC013740]|uniref:hypothetical protein n=1 Tax=Streptomyces sp. NPDC013740 TaxID=3364867 RepID=UPI0036F798BC